MVKGAFQQYADQENLKIASLNKIRTIDELREAIRDLEHQNYVNEQHMRRRVADFADRLKPMNIIKNPVGQFIGGTDIKTNAYADGGRFCNQLYREAIFQEGDCKIAIHTRYIPVLPLQARSGRGFSLRPQVIRLPGAGR